MAEPKKRKIMRVGVDFTEVEHREIEAAAVLMGITPGRLMEQSIADARLKDAILRSARDALKKAVT